MHIRLGNALALAAIVGAAAFAAGRSTSPSAPAPSPSPMAMSMPPMESAEPLPPGHPPTSGAGATATPGLPAGHPPIDPMAPVAAQAADSPETLLDWKAPVHWQLVPNASTMRLATYRVPRTAGDAEDAELSITQAGGSVEANADRWIGQFDTAAQKTAKRGTRKVGVLEVTTVEVQGAYSGGMGKDPSSRTGWALLGAIVSTRGMPHFFKLTGPAKSVLAARADFDAMLTTLVQR